MRLQQPRDSLSAYQDFHPRIVESPRNLRASLVQPRSCRWYLYFYTKTPSKADVPLIPCQQRYCFATSYLDLECLTITTRMPESETPSPSLDWYDNLSNAPLPRFEPMDCVSAVPKPTARYIPDIANILDAKYKCRAGDETILPYFENLEPKGTARIALQFCLPAEVASNNEQLVERLLALGAIVPHYIPGTIHNEVSVAIAQKLPRMLSLFVRHGWDIHKPVSWCDPPPLA